MINPDVQTVINEIKEVMADGGSTMTIERATEIVKTAKIASIAEYMRHIDSCIYASADFQKDTAHSIKDISYAISDVRHKHDGIMAAVNCVGSALFELNRILKVEV